MSARIGIGRAGCGVPTRAHLGFQLDHALARDAVHRELDAFPLPHLPLHSAAPDRAAYLRRPDLGRRLNGAARLTRGDYDAAIVVCDGLSPLAVTRHAPPLIAEIEQRLHRAGWDMAPLAVVLQARVAVGDEVACGLGARMAVVLIGERPGLSSPDSLGVYLTWAPRPGLTRDAERNCISNVRPEGLSYSLAAHKLFYLMTQARARQLTGVALKEDAPLLID